MRFLFPTLLLSLAIASPAVADDATLEGYGGDGALLVGIESKDSPFGDRAPGQQGGGARDGNLVAESGPLTAGSTQGAAATPGQPRILQTPAGDSEGGAARPEREGKPRQEVRNRPADEPSGTSVTPESAAPGPDVVTEGPEPAGASAGSLPFTGQELVLLLAAALGLLAIGAGMRRLALAQPRF